MVLLYTVYCNKKETWCKPKRTDKDQLLGLACPSVTSVIMKALSQFSAIYGQLFCCDCPGGLTGIKCDNRTGVVVSYPLLAHNNYAWVAGVLCFLLLSTALMIATVLYCRRKRYVVMIVTVLYCKRKRYVAIIGTVLLLQEKRYVAMIVTVLYCRRKRYVAKIFTVVYYKRRSTLL